MQVSLTSDPMGPHLLDRRELLRGQSRTGQLTEAEVAELAEVTALYDEFLAAENDRRSRMVAAVRAVAQQFRPHAEIFVGGVPMIAADMLDFVRADLVTFGAAIVGIMVLVLAVIFRDWRWVISPILNCVITAVLMLGILAVFDWRMTVISSNFVAVLLIVTLSLSVHLIVRYRELERVEPCLLYTSDAADE